MIQFNRLTWSTNRPCVSCKSRHLAVFPCSCCSCYLCSFETRANLEPSTRLTQGRVVVQCLSFSYCPTPTPLHSTRPSQFLSLHMWVEATENKRDLWLTWFAEEKVRGEFTVITSVVSAQELCDRTTGLTQTLGTVQHFILLANFNLYIRNMDMSHSCMTEAHITQYLAPACTACF